MRTTFSSLCKALSAFVEKQGFPIIVTICVAVITATALWTEKHPQSSPAPTSTVQNITAAQLGQQSLRSAATPSPEPTATISPFSAPLSGCAIMRPYTDSLVKSDLTGIWQIHNAVDLEADFGAEVRAAANGVILATGTSRLEGAWITIDHGNEIVLRYSGASILSHLSPGTQVERGDKIGIVAACALDEASLGPHLHLQAFRNGDAFDPTTLWPGTF